MHLIPFETKPLRKDVDLPDKLKEEYPAILAWVIEGAKAWLEQGLNPPKAVIQATDEYLAGEDALARWITERCVAGADNEMTTNEAFNDFRDWCKDNNEAKGRDWSQRKFNGEMKTHGYEPTRDRATRTKRVFRGLELLIGDADHMIINAMIDEGSEDFFGVQINFKADEGDE
jgi:putative DNA primase/helicase